MQAPKVIVLILSYNGKDLLDDSISSYLNNNYENFEVTVIDNGSTDGTSEYVNEKWPEVNVLRTEKNLGYSGGFNFGMDYAFNKKKAEYVLITNNDVKADSRVISELVKVAMMDLKIGFVTGKVYYYDEPNVLQTVGYIEDPIKWVGGHKGHKEIDKGQYNEICELPLSDDIFMLVSNKLYNNVGDYDISLKFQGEQMDWQVRGVKQGFKIFYAPKAMIWHKESMTIGKTSPFKTYYDVRNSLVVTLMHKDKMFVKRYLKWYLPNVVIKPLMKTVIKMKLNYSWAIISGFTSAIIWKLKN